MYQAGFWNHMAQKQIQGITYLHNWSNKTKSIENNGAFYWYQHGKKQIKAALSNVGILVDGVEQSHGSFTFMPESPAPNFLVQDDHYQI